MGGRKTMIVVREAGKAMRNAPLVISVLALFIALSGASYAALRIPAHSVGSAQIRSGAVTRAKLHAAAVGRNQVANAAIGGAEIADGSIEAFDLAPGVIPPNVTTVVHTVEGPKTPVCGASPCNVAGSIASCPSGERVVSGGEDDFTGGTSGGYSEPSTDRTAWIAGVANGSTYNGGWVQAYALCAPTGRAVTTRTLRPSPVARRDMQRALTRFRDARP